MTRLIWLSLKGICAYGLAIVLGLPALAFGTASAALFRIGDRAKSEYIKTTQARLRERLGIK